MAPLSGLALVHTKPMSALKCLFHWLMSLCPLLKIILFLGPNHPTCRDEYFPEYDVVKVCSGLKNHVEGAEVQVLADWNGCPTVSAEWTLEK